MLSSAVLCLLVSQLSASEDAQEIKTKAERDVTLQCLAHTDAFITLLEWSRPDLESHQYVFFYRNERSYEKYQHPSFRGRVELRDPKMKDGDASVILRNVSIKDTGTYKCQVTVSNMGLSRTTNPEIKHLVNLTVTDAGHTAGNKDGYLGLIVGLPVLCVLLVLVAVIGCIIIKKHKEPRKNHSYKRPAENAGEVVT